MLKMKRVGVVVGVVVLLAMFGHKNDGSSSSSAPSAASVSAPSCKTDWKLCADNSDMANNNAVYERARFECKYEANKLAKYGDPKWGWTPFSGFYSGDNYLKNGVATMTDKSAQFQNGFGAWAHVIVECEYDMNNKKVLNVSAF